MIRAIQYALGIPRRIMQAYDEAVEAGAVYAPARLEYIRERRMREQRETAQDQPALVGELEQIIG